MPLLDTATKDRIRILFGYTEFSNLVAVRLGERYEQSVIDRVLILLVQLVEIDEKIFAIAGKDTYKRVDDIEFRSAGNRELERLALRYMSELQWLLGIHIARNKYKPDEGNSISYGGGALTRQAQRVTHSTKAPPFMGAARYIP